MTASCTKCGRELLIPVSPECDPEAARMLAKFLVCENCLNPKRRREPEPVTAECPRGCPRDD